MMIASLIMLIASLMDPKVLDANGRGFCRPSGKGKFELQDGAVAIEFRSSAADAAGTLHTMICTNSLGTHVLPPMTTVTVEDVFAPGKWSLMALDGS
jgi:hypothetical protein